MASHITRFQRARWCVIFSLLLLALTIGVVLVNRTLIVVPQACLWCLALLAAVLGALGFAGYRCPNCRQYPEAGDVSMFNPDECVHCGTRLK